MKKYGIIVVLLLLPFLLFAKKPRIAVVDFDYKAGETEGSESIGSGFSDMLSTSLFKSGKFDVYERTKMNQILEEQKLGLTGLITPQTAAKIGNLLGVEYLVVGSINQFGQKRSTASAFGVSVDTLTARVATDIRLVAVESGKITASATGVGEETASGVAIENYDILPTDVQLGSADFDQTLVGKATKKCIDDLVTKLSKTFGSMPLEGKVIKVSGNKVYINLGKDSGIAAGQVFKILREGEELIDPSTGESLGSETTEIGSIKVTEINEKFSIAEIVKVTQDPANNDTVVIVK
jgi:curli biogenesis system outer membrane secretion channel CsgG